MTRMDATMSLVLHVFKARGRKEFKDSALLSQDNINQSLRPWNVVSLSFDLKPPRDDYIMANVHGDPLLHAQDSQ